jgi:hypothetical protein
VPPPQIGAWTFISYDEVTPVCPTAQTRCDPATPNAQINGVLGAAYYADFNLCNSTCTSYIVTFYNCCRNYAITSGAGGNGIFLDSTIIDLTITPCNSSPVFNNEPVPYICANYQFTFNQGAYDPDGDSLVYSIGSCNTVSGTNVTYNAGFSPTSPLGPNWIVTIDPQTGDVTFDPNPNGPRVVAVLCIIVEEYRNGIKNRANHPRYANYSIELYHSATCVEHTLQL